MLMIMSASNSILTGHTSITRNIRSSTRGRVILTVRGTVIKRNIGKKAAHPSKRIVHTGQIVAPAPRHVSRRTGRFPHTPISAGMTVQGTGHCDVRATLAQLGPGTDTSSAPSGSQEPGTFVFSQVFSPTAQLSATILLILHCIPPRSPAEYDTLFRPAIGNVFQSAHSRAFWQKHPNRTV